MSTLPDPVWPVVVLALIQVADGLLCVKSARFVAACLEGVRFPRRWWRLLPPHARVATSIRHVICTISPPTGNIPAGIQLLSA
ncbi:hypothetical protein [Catellatospora chokoriensis]|uniref:hypothetical protein n=1 Tax=Catellatospora chokoriensis TaxID=310353 RepID=UPI00177F2F29|nr:hypothetical protein [Catellatospora chokoriensis]